MIGPAEIITCKGCGEGKPISDYTKREQASTGQKKTCRKCERRDYKAQWRKDNRERINKLESARARKKYAQKKREARIAKMIEKGCVRSIRTKQFTNEIDWKNRMAKKKESNRRRAQELSPGYVAERIGISLKKCPTHLLQLKKEQLQIKRLVKTIKETINESRKNTR